MVFAQEYPALSGDKSEVRGTECAAIEICHVG